MGPRERFEVMAGVELDTQTREALRYCGGVAGAARPAVWLIDKLEVLRLVELREPGAWAIADRYRPTAAGQRMLEQIGARG